MVNQFPLIACVDIRSRRWRLLLYRQRLAIQLKIGVIHILMKSVAQEVGVVVTKTCLITTLTRGDNMRFNNILWVKCATVRSRVPRVVMTPVALPAPELITFDTSLSTVLCALPVNGVVAGRVVDGCADSLPHSCRVCCRVCWRVCCSFGLSISRNKSISIFFSTCFSTCFLKIHLLKLIR